MTKEELRAALDKQRDDMAEKFQRNETFNSDGVLFKAKPWESKEIISYSAGADSRTELILDLVEALNLYKEFLPIHRKLEAECLLNKLYSDLGVKE